MQSKSVIYINEQGEATLFDGNSFTQEIPKKIDEYALVTTLPLKNLKTYAFRSSHNTPREKLEVQAEINMYEEGGLDVDTPHSIDFHSIALADKQDVIVEVFAAEEKLLQERYRDIVKEYGYIDVISPTFKKYEALYTFDKLEKKNDLFIYFSENESYASMFKDGEFLSYKSLPSLKELSEKTKIEYETLLKLLRTKGLKQENYELDDIVAFTMIEESFTKIVEVISHAISHKRGLYGYVSIDRFFLDFQGEGINGFLELFGEYGFEESSFLKLNVLNNFSKEQQNDALNALYLLGGVEEHYRVLNFTIFDRKPPFYKTRGGIFLSVLFATFAIAMLYLLYGFVQLSSLEKKESKLQQKYTQVMQETKRLEIFLKKYKKKDAKLREKKKLLQDQIALNILFVQKLSKTKQNVLRREQVMKDVTGLLGKYHLLAKDINQTNSTALSITVISTYNNSDTIALFMKDMLKKGYDMVDTDAVNLEKNSYESLVKIKQ